MHDSRRAHSLGLALASALFIGLLGHASTAAADDAPTPFYKGAYVSPMASGVFPTDKTPLDNGYGGILAGGYRSNFYAMEIAPTYGEQKPGTFKGIAVNGLLFPFQGLPNLYGTIGLSGIQYTDYKADGDKLHFNTVNVDGGVGYLLPLSVGRYDFAIRAEARYRVGRREKEYNDRDIDIDAPRRFEPVLVNVGLYLPIGLTPPPASPPEVAAVVPIAKACSDGADNDGDGKSDYPADPGCGSADDDDETDPPACSDGKDNDGDGKIDFPADAGCSSQEDNDETDPCRAPLPGERMSLAGCGTGDLIVLQGVTFEFDKSRLTPNAKVILDGVSDELIAHPNILFEIGGHTDSKGSDEYNQRLSEQRAHSVQRYLSDKGIEARRMTAVGYGETQPVADNDTDEGREMNRRIELKITGSDAMPPVSSAGPAPSMEAPAEAAAPAEPAVVEPAAAGSAEPAAAETTPFN
ncbi:OmpA family protein [Hydrocarboniphaga sp.]|uniref:OmpA family protein n=1 Tax=Hydrocarboniphaga sp. TaxID=2033016 RepID=UPI003D0E5D4E